MQGLKSNLFKESSKSLQQNAVDWRFDRRSLANKIATELVCMAKKIIAFELFSGIVSQSKKMLGRKPCNFFQLCFPCTIFRFDITGKRIQKKFIEEKFSVTDESNTWLIFFRSLHDCRFPQNISNYNFFPACKFHLVKNCQLRARWSKMRWGFRRTMSFSTEKLNTKCNIGLFGWKGRTVLGV